MKWLLPNEDFAFACKNDNDWLIEILWENGIICEEDAIRQFIYASTDFDVPDCPFCGANDNRHYPLSDKIWKCKKCLKKFSITSGRYINNTKMPLTYWWRFSWVVAKSKILNSSAIARDLEITQKSAWLMVDTLKRAVKGSGVKMENGIMDFDSNWGVMKLLMRIDKK